MAKAVVKVPKKRKGTGYVMPERLPFGEILEDIHKKQWKLGISIGKGGFGEIYSALEGGFKSAEHVIKIEPHGNGPLFVEMHFYMRNAKQSDIQDFSKKNNLDFLGMPAYISSGSHDYNGNKYRFLVMEKFGADIGKAFQEFKRFPTATVYQIAIQILDTLEYIHSKGYVHADIKASNILLSPRSKSHVYLVDYGLASHYNMDPTFKDNPKKAHNGTIEYLSTDAHHGVETRRGDLEILGYNLIHWSGGHLPWEKDLSDPKVVQQNKETNMSNIPKFLKACFDKETPPAPIVQFFKYIKTLEFNSEPNYAKIREMFVKGLKEAGGKYGAPLIFNPKAAPQKRKAATEKAKSVTPEKRPRHAKKQIDEVQNEEEEEQKAPVQKRGRKKAEIPEEVNNAERKVAPVQKRGRKKAEVHEEEEVNNVAVVQKRGRKKADVHDEEQENNVEVKAPVAQKRGRKKNQSPVASAHNGAANGIPEDNLTAAMKEVLAKKKARAAKKPASRNRKATVLNGTD